ncbi:hypothetical protein F8M41_021915 [Gigaspora margarita]|uniref:Uncharacterized protein n=1 Tax=Gigaspora margarita TaxID=4874 RepID=A0A8H4B1C3_GIGMA|nr:hypothetical protein F8M41_021915 [Gigaspora margarita]
MEMKLNFPLPDIGNTDSEQFQLLPINDGIPVLSHGVHLCDSGGTALAYSDLNTVILNGICVAAIGNIII